MAHEPTHHLRHLWVRVVVHDDVDVARGGQLLLKALEELEEFLMPMPTMTLADDLAGGHIQ